MSLVCGRGVTFSFEHMTQMASTITADDLCSLHTKSAVCVPCHGTRDGVVERRPSAAGLELLLRGVERGIAAGAVVGA